jgi:hypothetical protein
VKIKIDNVSNPAISGKGFLQSFGSFECPVPAPADIIKIRFFHQCLTHLFDLSEARPDFFLGHSEGGLFNNFANIDKSAGNRPEIEWLGTLNQ